MAQIKGFNAHDRPPEIIRQQYKKYVKMPISEVDFDSSIIDLPAIDPDDLPDGISVADWMSSKALRVAFDQFVKGNDVSCPEEGRLVEDIPVFTHKAVSGERSGFYVQRIGVVAN